MTAMPAAIKQRAARRGKFCRLARFCRFGRLCRPITPATYPHCARMEPLGKTVMTARLLIALILAGLASSAGCCCTQTCGDPCGGPGCNTCCFSWPRPIVWNGSCNDCGPGPCESCSDCPQQCG